MDRNESVNKKLRERSVWFFVETYEKEFNYALSKASHWAFIEHNAEESTPHFHILLHYENARTGHAVLRDFAGTQNTFVEVAKNPLDCYEYLTHKNHPDKYQYASSCIISHNPVYWEEFLPSVRARPTVDNAEFLEDLLDLNNFDLTTMAKKYGRDFIKNYRSYIDFRNEVLPLTRKINYR